MSDLKRLNLVVLLCLSIAAMVIFVGCGAIKDSPDPDVPATEPTTEVGFGGASGGGDGGRAHGSVIRGQTGGSRHSRNRSYRSAYRSAEYGCGSSR